MPPRVTSCVCDLCFIVGGHICIILMTVWMSVLCSVTGRGVTKGHGEKIGHGAMKGHGVMTV